MADVGLQPQLDGRLAVKVLIAWVLGEGCHGQIFK
jgi:hypothetical protein